MNNKNTFKSSFFVKILLGEMLKFYLLACYFILSSSSIFVMAQNANKNQVWPMDVELNLQKAGDNREELELVIRHYYKKSRDSLKLDAAFFLIANMDIHYSANFYWADTSGNKILFNEMSYPDLKTARKELKKLENKLGKLTPINTIEWDLENLTADFLIQHIDLSFAAWQSSAYKSISFLDFCEYILPYRVTVEPIQDWRKQYGKRYDWLKRSIKEGLPLDSALNNLAKDSKWFQLVRGNSIRKEPLMRLGALQLLFWKEGECGDIASLQTFALRAAAIPASYNVVPVWATTLGRHYANTAFSKEMIPKSLDASNYNEKYVNVDFVREPAKVIRITYSKQNNVLANITNKDSIPLGFMRTKNYIDITDEYWPTVDLNYKTLTSRQEENIVYACVPHNRDWTPIWWGIQHGNQVSFTKIPVGSVILPAYYKNGTLVPSGYPIAIKNKKRWELIPNTERTIVIKEQARYLIFRPGKKYTLYYWDQAWTKLGEKKATSESRELVFEQVPSNALYLLVPEYTRGRERPFIITDIGERHWF